MAQLIRTLDPVGDFEAVWALYSQAHQFWCMTDRKDPTRATAEAFFTDTPPGCDAALSARLGFFEQDQLVGVVEMSFGFPKPEDAYLGLMLFEPMSRGRGLGPQFLRHCEGLARAKGCPRLYLAVLEENTKARAFWEANGFEATGLSGFDSETGHTLHRLEKQL